MSKVTENIEDLVSRFLPDENYFIVDIQVKGVLGKEKVMVLIDGDQGVDISVCSDISRKLSNELDARDLISGSYTLEVSSPGLDFPLKSRRQYQKNIGRSVKVALTDNSMVRGELIDVEDDGISIRKEQKKQKDPVEDAFISYEQIKKTNVLVTFK